MLFPLEGDNGAAAGVPARQLGREGTAALASRVCRVAGLAGAILPREVRVAAVCRMKQTDQGST